MKTNKTLLVLTLVLTLSLTACGIFNRGQQLKGTAWDLYEIHGKPILEGTNPTLVFETDSVGGNGSCNTFGGEYTANGEKLSFGGIFSTLMYCEDVMDQESAYFAALQEADRFVIKDGDLLILDANGGILLTLAPQK